MKIKTLAMVLAVALIGAAQAQEDMDFGAMMQALGALGQQAEEAGPAASVSPKALKDWLPKSLPGYERVEAGAEKQGMMGMQMVVANGVYEKGGKTITVQVSDASGLGPFGAMAMAGWAMSEIDKETRQGFERTAMCQGYKSLEKWDKSGQEAEVEVFVDKRFMVKVEGSGLDSFDELTAAAAGLDLKALAAIKAE